MNRCRALVWRLILALRGGRMGRRCIVERGACLASRPGHPVIVGDGVRLGRGVILSTARTGRIVIEDGATIRAGSVITSDAEIRIGAGSVVGPHVDVVDFNHTFDRLDVLVEHQPIDAAPIRIGRGVRLGAGAKVLHGVTIGDGARVADGAVVTRDVPTGGEASGVPARVRV
jgi:acetyltransferase-like isoleucine patch superfamily enzyme